MILSQVMRHISSLQALQSIAEIVFRYLASITMLLLPMLQHRQLDASLHDFQENRVERQRANAVKHTNGESFLPRPPPAPPLVKMQGAILCQDLEVMLMSTLDASAPAFTPFIGTGAKLSLMHDEKQCCLPLWDDPDC